MMRVDSPQYEIQYLKSTVEVSGIWVMNRMFPQMLAPSQIRRDHLNQ